MRSRIAATPARNVTAAAPRAVGLDDVGQVTVALER
jgi:hypothetical protein